MLMTASSVTREWKIAHFKSANKQCKSSRRAFDAKSSRLVLLKLVFEALTSFKITRKHANETQTHRNHTRQILEH